MIDADFFRLLSIDRAPHPISSAFVSQADQKDMNSGHKNKEKRDDENGKFVQGAALAPAHYHDRLC
jgi:hypothetical protein